MQAAQMVIHGGIASNLYKNQNNSNLQSGTSRVSGMHFSSKVPLGVVLGSPVTGLKKDCDQTRL
jgi:hypothetical protein